MPELELELRWMFEGSGPVRQSSLLWVRADPPVSASVTSLAKHHLEGMPQKLVSIMALTEREDDPCGVAKIVLIIRPAEWILKSCQEVVDLPRTK